MISKFGCKGTPFLSFGKAKRAKTAQIDFFRAHFCRFVQWFSPKMLTFATNQTKKNDKRTKTHEDFQPFFCADTLAKH